MPVWVIYLITAFCSNNEACMHSWHECVDSYYKQHIMVSDIEDRVYANAIKHCLIGPRPEGIVPEVKTKDPRWGQE